jgi:hypothetical protein
MQDQEEKEKTLLILFLMDYYAERMPRKQNVVQTVQITISTTHMVKLYLSALVATGLYGKTPAEAAERLISLGLERALTAGVITRLIAAQPTTPP